MKFPDDEIRYELPNSLRAHINKPSDISTDVTQSDSPGEQVAYKPSRDNDLDMTVPLVPDPSSNFHQPTRLGSAALATLVRNSPNTKTKATG